MINSDEITGDIRAEHNLREPQISNQHSEF